MGGMVGGWVGGVRWWGDGWGVGWDGGGMGGMVGGLVVALDHGFPLRDGNPSTMLPRCSSHMPQDDTNPLSRP